MSKIDDNLKKQTIYADSRNFTTKLGRNKNGKDTYNVDKKKLLLIVDMCVIVGSVEVFFI